MSKSSAHVVECPSSTNVSKVSISNDVINLVSCDKMDLDVDLLFALIEPIASLTNPPIIVETATIVETIEPVASLTNPLVKTATTVETDLSERVTCSISDYRISASRSLESRLTRGDRNYLMALKKCAQSQHKFDSLLDSRLLDQSA